MAEGTDLAGVIGTWVAVSLALVALFGIVAPILWMIRARDERRIALSKIDDESNEIVHPGIKIPFLPAIGRTISVPKLDTPPKLDGQVRGRDDRPLDRKHSATGWVMFTRTLKAYNISQPPNGILSTRRGSSWLPVHRLWILTIGLLGRYGHRRDRGRLEIAPDPGRIDQRDLESCDDPHALYGITGVLRLHPDDLDTIFFSSHDKDTRGPLKPDSVPFAVLFWLCMGCVPLLDGRVFDVSRERTGARYRSVATPRQRHNPSMLPTYRFQIIEASTPRSRILWWAEMLLGKLPELWWMCEYKVTTPEERVDIEGISGNSDDPEGISKPWIKTESLPLDKYFDFPSLLWRTDVQCLALGLLTMEWSPRGCLFDERRGDFSRRLLCSATSSLRALLEASCGICETSTSPTPATISLTSSIKNLLPMCPSSRTSVFSRALLGTLYDFEQVLKKNYTPDLDSIAIGIIFITSNIFREFVRNVREEDSHGNILTLDPNSKSFTIIAPGTFSDMRFVLDFDAVFNATLLPTPVSFTFEKVLFAALQACVRSLVFKLSLNSADLLDVVGQMEDIVFVSALPSLPLSELNGAVASYEAPVPSFSGTTSTNESTNDRIPSSRASSPRTEIESPKSAEHSTRPTRASSPRIIHKDRRPYSRIRYADRLPRTTPYDREGTYADRLPRTIYADGVPYTRETYADRLSTPINADPVPSPEATRIDESTVYSIHSGSEDQEYQHNSSPRGMLSTPERERLSTELELDHLESGIRSTSADATLQ